MHRTKREHRTDEISSSSKKNKQAGDVQGASVTVKRRYSNGHRRLCRDETEAGREECRIRPTVAATASVPPKKSSLL